MPGHAPMPATRPARWRRGARRRQTAASSSSHRRAHGSSLQSLLTWPGLFVAVLRLVKYFVILFIYLFGFW
jgi:hypothetical protein